MAFAPGKPNPVPPDVRHQEWINFLLDMNALEARNLARWLTANGIELPKEFKYVAGDQNG